MGAATVFSLGLLFFLQSAVLNHASPAHYLSGHATDAVKAATVEELEALPGVNHKVAASLKEWLAREGQGM